MKRLLLTCYTIAASLLSHAQAFILPTATERLGPSVSGTLPSSSYMLTDNVYTLSNTQYVSSVAGNIVKLAAWSKDYSSGPGGGFCFGYDDVSGFPSITTAVAIPNAVDLQVGFVEHPFYSKTYAVVSYYNYVSSSYECQLYSLSASTATLVYTKTLMACSNNRISMDVLGAKIVAFTWSDGMDVYTAVGKINGLTDQLDFSPSLAAPAIKLTGGAYNHTLPDVAAWVNIAASTDSVYYAFYNDSASQVNLLALNLDNLLITSSSAYSVPVRDYNTVSHSVMAELDAPDASSIEVWGYTYADSYVKVRHKQPAMSPVTVTINNGSLPKGPAAMSVSGADYHPVITYPNVVTAYALGWSTSRSTNPYAYPHSTAMVYVLMGPGDTIVSKKDYQLINSYPGASSGLYAFGPVSFSTVFQSSGAARIYASYLRTMASYSPWADLVHKNHLLSNVVTFKVAETIEAPALSAVPNPSNSSFQLINPDGINSEQQLTVTLTDMQGHSLMRFNGNLADANAQLKTISTNLATGTYVISAAYADQRQEFKVQKIAP